MNTHFVRAAQILRAISHPVRLRLLNALYEDEECVCHLTALVGKRQAYVSQHLGALRNAGLVRMRRDGLRVFYRLTDPEARAIMCALKIARGDARPARGCGCPHCAKRG